MILPGTRVVDATAGPVCGGAVTGTGIDTSAEPASVLVVDDHAINLRLTRRLLELEGHTAHTVTTGAAAIAAACELQPDLILSDLFLSDMRGPMLVRCLRSEPDTAALRVVAFTAAAMESDRVAALRAGFDGYLAKPVSARQFARFVIAQLSLRRRPDVAGLGALG